VILLVAALAWVFHAYLEGLWLDLSTPIRSQLVALAALALLWIIYRGATKDWRLGPLAEGADGRISTSKFQWLLWTVVTLYAYALFMAARAVQGHIDVPLDISPPLLYAMGLTATTMAAAKGITVAYVRGGQIDKGDPRQIPVKSTWDQLFKDDSGIQDLSKTQMLAWTFIALGTYVARLLNTDLGCAPCPELPKIEPVLLGLMGLGQAGYLAKKLASLDTNVVPLQLSGVEPAGGPPGTTIKIAGTSFGTAQGASKITIEKEPFNGIPLSWKDTEIAFKLPVRQPNGQPWPRQIRLAVVVDGNRSLNALPFVVIAPSTRPTGSGGAPPARATAVSPVGPPAEYRAFVPFDSDPEAFLQSNLGPYTFRSKTQNFEVYYDSRLGNLGVTLADGLLESCETDYNTIAGYFGIEPGDLPFRIHIDPGGFRAYHKYCATTDVHCCVTQTTTVNGVCMLVVAEVVEVFSDAQAGGWDCGNSNGEGLSRVLAADIYPEELNGYASADRWLNSDRQDFVNNTYDSDEEPVPIGCATLFLNWLRHDLGYTWKEIVGAGAPTLGETYAQLKNRTEDGSDGWKHFRERVDGIFPPGTEAQLSNDNPFLNG
jgi:hypothetical protein